MGKEIIKKKHKIEWNGDSYNAIDVVDTDGTIVTIASTKLWDELYPDDRFVSAEAEAKDAEIFGYISEFNFDSDEDILQGIRDNWEDDEIFNLD